MRRDYSIPDCPKIGRYDGLGMAAVPLAIADKERELGISHESSDYKSLKEIEEEIYNDDKEYDDAMKEMYKLGKKHGYEEGYLRGRIEVLTDFYEKDIEYIQAKINEDTYILAYGKDAINHI